MRLRSILLLVFAGVLLAACGGSEPVENQQEVGSSFDPTGLITGPVPAPSLGYEMGKEEFIATDPASVNMEGGYPQFIEFFAFW